MVEGWEICWWVFWWEIGEVFRGGVWIVASIMVPRDQYLITWVDSAVIIRRTSRLRSGAQVEVRFARTDGCGL